MQGLKDLVSALLNKKVVDAEILEAAQQIPDEPAAREILLLCQETDQFRTILTTNNKKLIQICCGELYQNVIVESQKDYLRKPGKRFLDSLRDEAIRRTESEGNSSAVAEEFAITIDQELTKGKSSSQENTATSDIRARITKLQRDIQSYTKESPIKASLALAVTAIAVVAIGLNATKQKSASSWEDLDMVCSSYIDKATHTVNNPMASGAQLLSLHMSDLNNKLFGGESYSWISLIQDGSRITAFKTTLTKQNSSTGRSLFDCSRLVPGVSMDSVHGWNWISDSEETLLPQDRKLELKWVELNKPIALQGELNSKIESVFFLKGNAIESRYRMVNYNEDNKPIFATPWQETFLLSGFIPKNSAEKIRLDGGPCNSSCIPLPGSAQENKN